MICNYRSAPCLVSIWWRKHWRQPAIPISRLKRVAIPDSKTDKSAWRWRRSGQLLLQRPTEWRATVIRKPYVVLFLLGISYTKANQKARYWIQHRRLLLWYLCEWQQYQDSNAFSNLLTGQPDSLPHKNSHSQSHYRIPKL